jgi:phosphoglucomutase
VKESGNFSYKDPIDGSVTENQGLYVRFDDGSRFVFRLSGTGSSGATIRLYVEKYTKDEKQYEADTQEGLKGVIQAALAFSKLHEFTGRDKPTVITVGVCLNDRPPSIVLTTRTCLLAVIVHGKSNASQIFL